MKSPLLSLKMCYVSKRGVVELRYLSETGTLVGEATDLYTLQDQLPTTLDTQRAFMLKNPDTKTQVSFLYGTGTVPHCQAGSDFLYNNK